LRKGATLTNGPAALAREREKGRRGACACGPGGTQGKEGTGPRAGKRRASGGLPAGPTGQIPGKK
jgi:hypothetical protein